MSAHQDGMMSAGHPQAAGAGMDAAAAQGVDPAAFTPEQWQAYQQAYTQAMQAQQLYAQAQQAYTHAEQTGQADVAQQAYAQAMQAQQMYLQAHQAYVSILQQAQAQAGAVVGGPEAAQGMDPQAAHQQAMMQQQAMAQQQAMMQQQAMAHGDPQMDPQQQAMMQQQAMAQQQAYAQGMDPQQQAMMQQQAMAQQQAMMQQQAMAQQQGMGYGQDPYAAQQQGYAPQQGYGQGMASQQSMPSMNAGGGDPLDSAVWDDAVYDDSSIDATGSSGGIFYWIFGIALLVGGFIALHFATQPPKVDPNLFKDLDDDPKEKNLTKAQKAWRRKKLRGELEEKPSPNLRMVPFALPSDPMTRVFHKWRDVFVAGKGECRTIYLTDDKNVYAAEGVNPKDSKDYIRKIHPDYPLKLHKLALPPRTFSRQLVQTPAGGYLMLRSLIASQSWMLLYPLIGNPLKGPGRKRGAECGDSGRPRGGPGYRYKKKLVLLGEGSCSLASSTLGSRPHLCLSGISVPNNAPLWYFQSGRRLLPPKGHLLLGTHFIKLKRRAKANSRTTLFSLLQRSTLPTFSQKQRKWIAIEKPTRQLWTLSRRAIDPTGVFVPVLTKDAVRAFVGKKELRIVYPNRLLKFQIVGKKLKRTGIYPFGTNVKIRYASWSQDGHILFMISTSNKIFQFSEK